MNISALFKCTRCGYCCQGETTVSLDDDDQQRMIEKLDMTREEVARRFWRITGTVVQMKTVDGHCIFYNNDRGCSVHEARPWRCGQWPLHPSILKDKSNFTAISQSCPGIRKELGYDEFCRRLRRLLAQQEKVIC
ncbi:MAG TPA: YkgJ family cysteine cluster protein [Desulfobulbus sp.]|nr:YkgJ family cysteine cluster protein [Desulfobulbus sp.]